jgi:hypothetical protein
MPNTRMSLVEELSIQFHIICVKSNMVHGVISEALEDMIYDAPLVITHKYVDTDTESYVAVHIDVLPKPSCGVGVTYALYMLNKDGTPHASVLFIPHDEKEWKTMLRIMHDDYKFGLENYPT